MSKQDFYSGLLTALIGIQVFDEPTIQDEIIDTLGERAIAGLIRFAKKNEEYELSGLARYVTEKQQEKEITQ